VKFEDRIYFGQYEGFLHFLDGNGKLELVGLYSEAGERIRDILFISMNHFLISCENGLLEISAGEIYHHFKEE
jgi:hypothetical protein